TLSCTNGHIVICRSTGHVAVEPAADIRARLTPTAATTGSRPIVRRRIGALDRRTLIVAWRLGPVRHVILRIRLVRLEREADVMRHREHARLDLERRDPGVLRETAGDQIRDPLDDV